MIQAQFPFPAEILQRGAGGTNSNYLLKVQLNQGASIQGTVLLSSQFEFQLELQLQTEMPKIQVKYLLTFIPGCDSAELSNAGVSLDATYCSYAAKKNPIC